MRLSYEQIAQAMAELHVGDGLVETRTSFHAGEFPMQPLGLASAPVRPAKLTTRHWIHAVLNTVSLFGVRTDDLTKKVNVWWDQWEAKENQAGRQAQIDQGQRLLGQWHKEGFLDDPIHLHPGGTIRANGVASVLRSTKTETPRHVIMNVRPQGDISSSLNPRIERMIRNTHEVQISTPVFRQWLALAHESAHTVSHVLSEPFSPSHTVRVAMGGEPEELATQIKNLNRDLFGPGANGWFYGQFDEAFADVYGAMILLRTTDFHPQAMNEVVLSQTIRKANHDWLVRQECSGWKENGYPQIYEVTAPAIELLLSRRAEWENLPPEKIRDVASEVVSDAWLQVAAGQNRIPAMLSMSTLLTRRTCPPLLFSFYEAAKNGQESMEAWTIDPWPKLAGTAGHQLGDRLTQSLYQALRGPPTRETIQLALVLNESTPALDPFERMDQVARALHPFVTKEIEAWKNSPDGKTLQWQRKEALAVVLEHWTVAAEISLDPNRAISEQPRPVRDSSLMNMGAAFAAQNEPSPEKPPVRLRTKGP